MRRATKWERNKVGRYIIKEYTKRREGKYKVEKLVTKLVTKLVRSMAVLRALKYIAFIGKLAYFG